MERKPTMLVRLDLDVYRRLDAVRTKGETFSQAVDKVTTAYQQVIDMKLTLGPSQPVPQASSGGEEG